jgi:hypothetical protein
MTLSLPKTLAFIAIVYLLTSFVHGPIDSEELQGFPHLQIGSIALAPPMVLSGDSPHFLVVINSLILDRDFDVSNNYDRARNGGLDAGIRFRGHHLDRHVDTDVSGRQFGTHSPFFGLMLAPFLSPFAGTVWVEPVSIWLTLMVGLAGIWLFGIWLKDTGFDEEQQIRAVLLLAFATSLLCYSRDLWTEPFVLLCWIMLLVSTNPWTLVVAGLSGTLIKYPFAVVPFTMGLIALKRRQMTQAWALLSSACGGILVTIGTIQWIFRKVDHFSLFHSGRHRGFDLPFDGIAGLLLGPETGLLIFFPFLAWGFLRRTDGWRVILPAVIFFMVHASYQGWHGGTGFSARYLVPLLPIATLAAVHTAKPTTIFKIAAIYSVGWGLLGGFLPALVYDRSPWDVLLHIWRHL